MGPDEVDEDGDADEDQGRRPDHGPGELILGGDDAQVEEKHIQAQNNQADADGIQFILAGHDAYAGHQEGPKHAPEGDPLPQLNDVEGMQ